MFWGMIGLVGFAVVGYCLFRILIFDCIYFPIRKQIIEKRIRELDSSARSYGIASANEIHTELSLHRETLDPQAVAKLKVVDYNYRTLLQTLDNLKKMRIGNYKHS